MEKPGAVFPPTPWSLLVRIRNGSEEQRAEALERVCASYWGPLYVFARVSGLGAEDAEDLTQDFLARALRSGLWEQAEQEKGRLRSLLIASFKRELVSAHRRRRAAKRGGHSMHVPIDPDAGECVVAIESASGCAPDEAYEHAWALAVFQAALEEVERNYLEGGEHHLFRELQPQLMLTGAESQRELAARLDLSESALKRQVYRLRRLFREHFRFQVRQTLTDEDDLDSEVKYLLTVIRNRGGL